MRDALERTTPKGSKLARTGTWSAGIGMVLVLVAGLGARAGLLSPFAGMGAYALGSLAMLVALVTAGLGLIRGRGSAPGATWLALAAAVAVTAINVNMSRSMGSPYHDIATDAANPPAFVAVAPLRKPDENPVDYTGPGEPPAGVGPLVTGTPAGEVFAMALEVVKDNGWVLVDASEAEGRIEATAETGWVRFKDDVVIRVADIGGQTRVDVRSKSRVGRGDMGVNAKRVQAFLADLEARLGSG